MKRIKKLFDYFIFGNVFISIAAVCFSLETYLLLHEQFHFDGVLVLVFFSTFFIYNNHRLVGFKKGIKNPALLNRYRDCFVPRNDALCFPVIARAFRPKQSIKLYQLNYTKNLNPYLLQNTPISIKYYKITVLIAIAGISISLFFCSFQILLSLIPLGFISFAYSVPLIPNNGHFMRLREIPGLKILFVSLVWAFTTVLIPAMNVGKENIFNPDVLLLFSERMLFMYAITIPFDIKDCEKDRSENVKTIPLMIGERRARLSALLALLIFFLMTIYNLYSNGTNVEQSILTLAFILSALTTGLLIVNSSQTKSIYYFLFLLDGTMMLQFLLVLLAHYI